MIGLISCVVLFHSACVLFVLIGKLLGYEAPGRRDDDVTGYLLCAQWGHDMTTAFRGWLLRYTCWFPPFFRIRTYVM